MAKVVGVGLDELVDEGMIDGNDEPASWGEDASQLAERRRPVLEVVQHQSGDRVAEGSVSERERVA